MTKGRYRLPFVFGPHVARQPAPFHQTDRSMRSCIDWAMPIGTPVLAARDGRVLQSCGRFWASYNSPRFSDRANFVTLLHADGQESFYVHLAFRSVRVRVGDRVNAGQIIGRSGQTGYSEYPHLHFGVYSTSGANIRIPWATIPELSQVLRIHRRKS